MDEDTQVRSDRVVDIEGLVEGIMFDTIDALSQAGLSWSPLRESQFENNVRELIEHCLKMIDQDQKIKEFKRYQKD